MKVGVQSSSRFFIWSHAATEMYRAISLNSAVAISTILLSVGTNKIISVSLGTQGIAVAGMFRTFAAIFSAAFGLGYATLFNQHMAASLSDEVASRKTIELAKTILLLQGLLTLFAILILAIPLSSYFDAIALGEDSVLATRIVLFMVWVNVAFQNALALLRGAGLLKKLALVQVAVSLVSLIVIFPLLKMGNIGLAVNVGSGNVIGMVLAYYLLQHSFPKSKPAFAQMKEAYEYIRTHLKSSFLLIWQSVLVMAALFFMQTFVGRAYGINELGIYNAAYLVVDTALLVLMSSSRSYFLPKLAQLQTEEEKFTLLASILDTHLLLAAAGCTLLVIGTRTLLLALFSKMFVDAGPMLQTMGLGIFGFVFTWIYNTFLLERGKHSVFVLIDTLWIGFFTLFVFLICRFHWQPIWLARAYFLSSLFSAGLYVLFVSKMYGARYFPWKTILKASLAILCIGGLGTIL